jgi:tetratricopeptide (TPR) repeat protein
MGLAEAYKGRGNVESFKKYLKKAAEVHAQFDHLEETKALFIEILKYESDTPNPFNTLGVNLRKQGDYPGALHAYRQALELTPSDENIHFNMAKALYYMGKLDESSTEVIAALLMNHGFTEAQKLYQRIHGKLWTPPAGKIAKPRHAHRGTKESAKDLDP